MIPVKANIPKKFATPIQIFARSEGTPKLLKTEEEK